MPTIRLRDLLGSLGVWATLLLGACAPGAAATPVAPTQPVAAEPGLGWATFLRDDCEWSAAQSPPAVCFGNRGAGFRVRAIRAEGSRWYVWDPSTSNYAYVDRAALSLPAELTAAEPADAPPSRTAIVCVDRSSGYRYTRPAAAALAAWIERNARSGDVFYVRWIEDNSYRPEAEAIPALRLPPPTSSAASVPTPAPPNPFDVRQVAQATATARAIETVAADAAAAQAASLHDQLASFARIPPGAAATADVAGCLQKAAELLANVAGDRLLIVATSARESISPTQPLALDRAQIRLVYLQCDDAARWDRARQAWSTLAASANAANIRFSDPSQALEALGG